MTIYAWTPCSDGTIKKVDETSIVMSVDTGCAETWIAVANKLALVPGRRGEVVSMNGLGSIKDRRTLQHRIAIAVGVVNDVYCFDGRGKGTIVTLDNNGLITVGEKVTCAGIVDPMNAILDGTTIYVACRNEDVYSFETISHTTVRVSRNRDDVLTSVVDNDTVTKLRNNAIYARLFGGVTVSGIEYFIGNTAIYTTTNRIADTRIRSDGVCITVGSDGTQFIKTCPSRNSIQWIENGTVSSEIFGVKSGGIVFAPSTGSSDEVPQQEYGSGVYSGDYPFEDIPIPVYSTVTFTIYSAPDVVALPGAPTGNVGHGHEVNGTYTRPFSRPFGNAWTIDAINVTSDISFAIYFFNNDDFQTLTCGSGFVNGSLQCNVNIDKLSNQSAWIAATTQKWYVGDIGDIPFDVIDNNAQWPPQTCPGQYGRMTIVSWNR